MSASNWAGICRFGGVGDNLIAASVLRPLKKLGYKVEVITTAGETGSVFRNNPFIDKLAFKQEGEIPGGEDWQRWFAARAGEYDIFVNLSHTCEAHHALFKGSTQFWWPQDFRRKLCGGSYLETVHDVVGVPHLFGPLFFPTEEERDQALKLKEQTSGPFLAWVVSGSRVDKIYPYAAMAIGRIIRELDIPVVIFGIGPKQHEMAVQMRDHVRRQNGTRDKLFVAVQDDVPEDQRWPLRTALTAACVADCVVTPDTGMAWAVAMEPMPKIMLLSHASKDNITKHWVNTTTLHADPDRVPCWPCHRLHDDISTCTPTKDMGQAAACITDISVETIVAEVDRAWNKQRVIPFRKVA